MEVGRWDEVTISQGDKFLCCEKRGLTVHKFSYLSLFYIDHLSHADNVQKNEFALKNHERKYIKINNNGTVSLSVTEYTRFSYEVISALEFKIVNTVTGKALSLKKDSTVLFDREGSARSSEKWKVDIVTNKVVLRSSDGGYLHCCNSSGQTIGTTSLSIASPGSYWFIEKKDQSTIRFKSAWGKYLQYIPSIDKIEASSDIPKNWMRVKRQVQGSKGKIKCFGFMRERERKGDKNGWLVHSKNGDISFSHSLTSFWTSLRPDPKEEIKVKELWAYLESVSDKHAKSELIMVLNTSNIK